MKKTMISLLQSIIISFLFISALSCSKTFEWQWATKAGGDSNDFGKAITTDEKIKKVLYDIANEEKTHIGEFQALLLKYDKEQEGELKKGSEEVEEI